MESLLLSKFQNTFIDSLKKQSCIHAMLLLICIFVKLANVDVRSDLWHKLPSRDAIICNSFRV